MTSFTKVGLCLLCIAACGAPPPPEPVVPTPHASAVSSATARAGEPAAVAVLPLRTGSVAAKLHPEAINATVVERGAIGDDEIYRVALPDRALDPLWGGRRSTVGTVVSVDGESGFGGTLFEMAWPAKDPSEPPVDTANFDITKVRRQPYGLWLRRRASASAAPLTARLHLPGYDWDDSNTAALVVVVNVDTRGNATTHAKFDHRWSQAVSDHLKERLLTFSSFAARRLSRQPPAPPDPSQTMSWMNWSSLMELTSGAGHVEAALQERSHLRSEVDRFRPTLPFTSATPPRMRRHPWKAMLQMLQRTVPDEPLAKAAPAEFYYVRADDVGVLFQLLDEVEAWGTPLLHLVEGSSEHRRLSQRYRMALGLPGSELSKVMGPKVIRRLAFVGSDPFLRQGSDVTLVADVKSGTLFRTALERELSASLAGRGGAERTTIDHHGTAIAVVRSADGAVSQHRASQGDLEIVSTSRAAIMRVLDTIAGRAPALSAELDFQYMLARDATVKSQVLVYAGDAFIAHAVGPRSRILDARRQVAAAELRRPAYAALLHGWLHGNEPVNSKSLLDAKLMLPSDLKHFDGSAITFEPGTAPRSSWGTPPALTPIIELPEPGRITKVEHDAYHEFARRYESVWSDALDPIALRLSVEGDRRINANLRVLPLLRDHGMLDITRLSGDAQIAPGRMRDGARLMFAIAPDSKLRRELSQTSQQMLGAGLKLDWIGDYAMVGVLDRPELANALHRAGLAPELRDAEAESPNKTAALMQLPLYAAIAVKERTAAAIVVIYLRSKFADDAKFKNAGEYRGQTIVRASVERDLSFYYTLSDRALYVALQPWVIETLLDEEAHGDLPHKPAANEPNRGQATLEVKATPHGGLVTALQWLFERESGRYPPRAAAEMLLVGAPSTQKSAARYEALSLAYLGAIPFTVDAKPFELRASGAADPMRGNVYERSYPNLPIAGAPAAAVLDALAFFRAQVGFEREPMPPGVPEEHSLTVGMTIGRR